MYRHLFSISAILFIAGGTVAQAAPGSVVITSDLQAPAKVRWTPRGNLVVAENGRGNNQGRVSLVTLGGSRRTLVEGLPAGLQSEDEISGPNDVLIRDRTLYVLIGVGDAEIVGPRPGTNVPNPAGVTSPLFSSLLAFRFPVDIDDSVQAVTLTPALQSTLADGNVVDLPYASGQTVQAEVVVDFRDLRPDPQNIYRGSNPYSMTLGQGNQLLLADASFNTLVSVDLGTGRSRTLMRFGPINNPTGIGAPRIDPVPNAVYRYNNGYLVSHLSGFPFARGLGRLDFYNPSTGAAQTFLPGLTMPLDIAVSGQRVYVLEFSTRFTAQPPEPGRLVVYDGGAIRPLLDNLVTPTSLVIDPVSGDVLVTELATGRLLRVFAANQ